MAGGDRTTRGFLIGWDPETGQKLWTRYTIPAPGEPGSETWPKDIPDAWKYGGGSTWQNGSYDPDLDLVYWGTGNAEPYDPIYRARQGQPLHRERDRAFARRPARSCVLSVHSEREYDFDGTAEPVLADITDRRAVRKVMIQANKNGFMYVLDRTNGKLIAAPAYRESQLGSHIDLHRPAGADRHLQPRPQRRDRRDLAVARHRTRRCRRFNPKTGLIYVNSWEISRIMKIHQSRLRHGRQGSTGVDTSFRTPPAGEPSGLYMASIR